MGAFPVANQYDAAAPVRQTPALPALHACLRSNCRLPAQRATWCNPRPSERRNVGCDSR
jgi:hypothetical protein